MPERIIGVSKKPVLAVPVLRVVGSHATFYESRTYSNNGAVILSEQRAPERAINRTIRPKADIIEVGPYSDQNYDLMTRIDDNDGKVVHNGVEIKTDNKVQYIRSVVQKKCITRIVTHEQHPSLPTLAKEVGILYKENIDMFEKLGTKSGLNMAISDFDLAHPSSCLVPCGTNFKNEREAKTEVERLRSAGIGSYIKTDFADSDSVAAGGEGHLALPLDIQPDEAANKIDQMLSNRDKDKKSGVVQMLIPKPKVYAISSGEDGQGHNIYEAHIQSVDGATAEGATPLDDSTESITLINTFWPEVKIFFKENNITGDANINCVVIPPHLQKLSEQIYPNRKKVPIALIDFNYRSISGTKNAMSRFQEDTGGTVNQQNFKSGGIKVDRFFAANPHLIYVMAQRLGLKSGPGGNMSVINIGTFNPQEFKNKDKFKTQVFINDTVDPKKDLSSLEEILSRRPDLNTLADLLNRGYNYVDVDCIGNANQIEYTYLITKNMITYLNEAARTNQ